MDDTKKTVYMSTGYNASSISSGSLKGKLLALEETVESMNSEINEYKKEVQILRSEKKVLEDALNGKVMEVRKNIMNEVNRVEEDLKRQFSHQKSENSKLQQQIFTLKSEKTAMQQQLLEMQRRISELETQIGSEDH
jgi:chromosome segregation ATPase